MVPYHFNSDACRSLYHYTSLAGAREMVASQTRLLKSASANKTPRAASPQPAHVAKIGIWDITAIPIPFLQRPVLDESVIRNALDCQQETPRIWQVAECLVLGVVIGMAAILHRADTPYAYNNLIDNLLRQHVLRTVHRTIEFSSNGFGTADQCFFRSSVGVIGITFN